MPCVITGKGQVTIPKTIREFLNIHPKGAVRVCDPHAELVAGKIRWES
jgi:AbrB family looped-hinge helix DNA binding protein